MDVKSSPQPLLLNFHRRDICDPKISSLMAGIGIEKSIHIAFIIDIIHYTIFGRNRHLTQPQRQGPVYNSAFNGIKISESCMVDIPDSSYYTDKLFQIDW
jgi:hypothetical protein